MPNNFNSNPNQKNIKINKELTDDKAAENYYAKINLIALQEAMQSLSLKAFELWIYFSKNIDKHSFYLSKVDFLNWGNMSASSYYEAFKELVRLKYLIPIDKENPEPKHYNFFEKPREEKSEPITVTINKEQEVESQYSYQNQYKGFVF